ncbi:MAG: TonB-dependent receptor [Dysgonamonadaceae bacterium]|jgi:iron complex outermembrane receptor protein|nr:TonB-dependent receptor [Dysgonamonadaceae bacterium]
MKLRVILFLSLMLSFGSLSLVHADDGYTIKDTVLLQTVEVVSATKTEVNRNQIPLTVSVVGREIIDESTETGVLSILSEQVPGVFVTERSVTGYGINNGSAGAISIHGVGDGTRVLMLFDGQPNWAGIFGHHIPDAYAASDAERVEIIRGPGSLLYGSNAMGGVVNVITRKATENGFHGNARTLYGSYNTWKIRGSAGYKQDKFDALVSFNHDQSDGHRENSAFRINNGYVKLGYRFSDYWQATGNAIIADFKINNPGATNSPMFENWAEALRGTYSLSVNNRYDRMSGAVQVFYNNGRHRINDGYSAGRTPQVNYFKSNDFNTGVAVYESFRLLDNNLFTVGIDAKQWGGKAWNEAMATGKETYTMMDTTVTEWAGYAVVQHTLWDKWTLNAGIRLENNRVYGNEWIPQAGVAYQFNHQTTFKASASKGFRSPNVNDLFSPWGSNPDLKPEEMQNFDFSYIQSLPEIPLQLEITAYWAKGNNLIQSDANGKKQNVGSFINKGVDFSFHYRALSNLTVTGNYSYFHSDKKLLVAPRHKAYLSLQWKVGKFSIHPNLQSIHGLYLGTAGNEDIDENYTLLNCKLSYKPTQQLTVFINGENLTGADYQTYLGFPMPGIVVLGGIDYRF